MSGASANDLLSSAMASTLAPHLDEDTAEYVTSLLSEDPSDTDAREAVMALVSGSVEEDADDICTTFFQLLDFGSVGSGAVESGDKSSAPSDADTEAPMRRLEQSVTLKENLLQPVGRQYFAWTLSPLAPSPRRGMAHSS